METPLLGEQQALSLHLVIHLLSLSWLITATFVYQPGKHSHKSSGRTQQGGPVSAQAYAVVGMWVNEERWIWQMAILYFHT